VAMVRPYRFDDGSSWWGVMDAAPYERGVVPFRVGMFYLPGFGAPGSARPTGGWDLEGITLVGHAALGVPRLWDDLIGTLSLV